MMSKKKSEDPTGTEITEDQQNDLDQQTADKAAADTLQGEPSPESLDGTGPISTDAEGNAIPKRHMTEEMALEMYDMLKALTNPHEAALNARIAQAPKTFEPDEDAPAFAATMSPNDKIAAHMAVNNTV